MPPKDGKVVLCAIFVAADLNIVVESQALEYVILQETVHLPGYIHRPVQGACRRRVRSDHFGQAMTVGQPRGNIRTVVRRL